MGKGSDSSGADKPKPKRARKSASPRAKAAAAPGEAISPTQPQASPGAPIRARTPRKPKPKLDKSRALSPKELKDARLPPPPETSKRASSAFAERLKDVAAGIERAEERERERAEAVAKRVKTETEKAAVLAGGAKRGRGRPTEYREWMCDAVIEFGCDGLEVVEFAVALGVCRDTLYEWADKHPDFSDALKRAREASEAWWIAKIRGQAQLPAQATNLAATLGYMGRRFAGWREASKTDDHAKTTPVSTAIQQGRARAKAAAAEAREAAAREAGI